MVAFWKFTALRLGIVAVIFVICMWLGVGLIFSALVAAVAGWCITYLFFREMRDAASESLRHRFSGNAKPLRTSTEISDAMAEDEAVDRYGELRVDSDRKPKDTKPEDMPTAD
ncbi:Protein of unknown function (DUF4229) [Arthrobacter sp. VKM Ac-2550]|nr:Protein of unknown function (DUF4229) [Arthrobacter sp. VKM Ac-2550]